MNQVYTIKQVVGGLLLVVTFIMVFILNMLKREYNMLVTPILVGITICLLGYILVLNEIIKTKKELLLKKDNYQFKKCPDNYQQNTRFIGKIKEIKCTNSNATIPSFLLQSTQEECDKNLGCFNKTLSRKQKCEEIKDFFKQDTEVNQENGILNNWSEYQNQCVL